MVAAMADRLDIGTPPTTGNPLTDRTRERAIVTESKDTIRNLKASESVMAAFLRAGMDSGLRGARSAGARGTVEL
ncbi:hypothetical protein XH88_27180 [Bradyrhizobium sp. CCBAU 51627]|nr:hypothetical protein [Bradyrhizobium sp. CCBAU 51627]